jgi:hypothetical protein
MIKQKLTLTLGLISILLGSLAASPPRANAGQAVIQGTTADSSGTIGDSFSPDATTPELTTPTARLDADVDNTTGEVNLTILAPELQLALDSAAAEVLPQLGAGGTPDANTGGTPDANTGGTPDANAGGSTNGNVVITLVTTTNNDAVSEVTSDLQDSGVTENDASELAQNLQGILVAGGSQSQVRPEQLVAAAKNLKTDSAIAQAAGSPRVDINKLHQSIEAYNNIIKKSDLPTLQKLSKNETFMAIGKLLKTLRGALNEAK